MEPKEVRCFIILDLVTHTTKVGCCVISLYFWSLVPPSKNILIRYSLPHKPVAYAVYCCEVQVIIQSGIAIIRFIL